MGAGQNRKRHKRQHTHTDDTSGAIFVRFTLGESRLHARVALRHAFVSSTPPHLTLYTFGRAPPGISIVILSLPGW